MSVTSEIAIRVASLSKEFKLYSHPSDMLLEILRGKPRYKSFWALREVSFDIYRGQVVGLIGRNGAGKSTLLKIISGTLDKTSGEVEVRGRISSILELGTGFSGEYTGRENVYLGGLMVGLSHEEIREKEDWIIEFSELQDFIDQPFKTYSTGMQARLTFATAVCIDPDILIVDETLAVGDARFQRKSFGQIDKFRKEGRTILLVSHDINTISAFCDYVILLDEGRIYDQGEAHRIGQVYYKMMFSRDMEGDNQKEFTTGLVETYSQEINLGTLVENPQGVNLSQIHDNEELRLKALNLLGMQKAFKQDNPHRMRMGNKKAEILDYGILDEAGSKISQLNSGKKYIFYFRVLFYEDANDIAAGFLIRNIQGVSMFGINTQGQKLDIDPKNRGDILEVKLRATMVLTNGIYFLSCGVGDLNASTDVQYDYLYDGYQFEVATKEGIHTDSLVDLNANFEVHDFDPANSKSKSAETTEYTVNG